MAAKTALSIKSDTYSKLADEFRLSRIKDDDHLKAAHKMVDRLLQENLDPSGQDYLDVLAGLVEAYEDRHFPIPDAPEADVLRELIRSSGLSQSELSEKVGIVQPTISAVLNGHRSLTKKQVIRLAEFFGVAPAAFLSGRTAGGKSKWSTDPGTSASGANNGIAAASHT